MGIADERKGMMNVIRRNDPCPCGSGKKYKKCHGNVDNGARQLVEEELKRVMATYIANTPASGPDRAELSLLVKTWMSQLGGRMKSSAIEGAAYEHFVFNIRRDLWQQHLKGAAQGAREEVKRVLQAWHEPVVMFTELIGKEDGYLFMREVFGDGKWSMKEHERVDAAEGTMFFGTVLADPREREDAIQPVSTLYSVPAEHASVKTKISEFASTCGEEPDGSFFESHLADIFALLHTPAAEAEELSGEGTDSMNPINETKKAAAEAAVTFEEAGEGTVQAVANDEMAELTDGQRDTVVLLDHELETDGLSQEIKRGLRDLVIRYFIEENPIVRKPGGIIAGVYLASQEKGYLTGETFTAKEAAKRFGVSEGTAQKYAAVLTNRLK